MTEQFPLSYAVPTALLLIALVLKFPTLVRAWRDPDVRATTLLLSFATVVLVVITPVNIARLNELTGVPNIASPWAYSFLTAFCATGLTMIMRWREEPSPRRRRRMRRVYWIYAGIVVALWVTFLLADVPEPRIYDLDTYYAGTPWMREHILLYLSAHMVSSLVATSMLWKWFPRIENRWLKSGVVCLQAGFASGLVFDAAKLTALTARWSGHDWDVLSTRAAPPFALLEAVLVAVGFIVPQVGPSLQNRIHERREYRQLRPLWSAVRDVVPSTLSPGRCAGCRWGCAWCSASSASTTRCASSLPTSTGTSTAGREGSLRKGSARTRREGWPGPSPSGRPWTPTAATSPPGRASTDVNRAPT